MNESMIQEGQVTEEPQEAQPTISQAEVDYWKSEIRASRKFRQKEFIDRIQYKKLIGYYEGIQADPNNSEYLKAACVNEIYPAFESILANAYVQNPTINVKAKNPKAEGNLTPIQEFMIAHGSMPQTPPLTDLMKAAIGYGIEHYGLKGEAQLALFDLLFAGFGCIEVNHKVIKDQSIISQAQDEKQAETFFDKAKSLIEKITNPNNKDDAALKVAAEQQTEKRDSQIDDTYINWWNPLEILFDYRAKVFSRSRYIGKEVEMTIGEFKNEYPAFADKIPVSDYKKLEYSESEDTQDNQIVKLVELQIKRTDGVYGLVTCDSIREAIAFYKRPITTNGFSVKYGCLDKYGTIYPVSRARLAKDSQDELNHYVRVESDTVDRSPRKVAIFEEGLTEAGKTQAKSADVYSVVTKKIPGPVFEAMPVGGVAPETKDLQAIRTENINKLAGTNELAKSGKSESEFATQDNLKNQAFNSQSSLVQDALRDLLVEVIDGLKDIIMQLWDGEYYFKITGLPGGDFWYTPEMGKLTDVLLGDYLIEVDIASAQRRNPMQDRSELTELVMGLMNPAIAGFLQSKGYTLSIGLIEEWIKTFGKNPKVILERMEAMPGMMPGMLAVPPGAPIPGPQPMPMQETAGR